MSARIRIFVASATESMHVAQAFAAVLDAELYEVTQWPDAFNANEFALEDLLDIAQQCDFAVFVFGPDDELSFRGEVSWAPRDNVVFELGLFAGLLGRRRTFMLAPKDGSVKIPSDLKGLGYSTYVAPDAPRLDGRWKSALRNAAFSICSSIEQQRSDIRMAGKAAAGGTGMSDHRGTRLAAAGGDHLELFRVVDGRLEHAWHWGQWSGWVTMPTPQPVREVAAGSHGGYVDVFAVSNSGTLWHRWWGSRERWSEWENWGSAAGPVAVASAGPDHIEVFYQHAGSVFHRWFTNGEWSELTPFH